MSNVLNSSKTDQWFTPQEYIDAARDVLGGFDLDPASNHKANLSIGALEYFSEGALSRPWFGRVWLNPPYGKLNGLSNQALWTAKLLIEYRSQRVSSAICLVNATTDRKWFSDLWHHPICFTDHRIKFEDAAGSAGTQPTHGNAFVFLGDSPEGFSRVFSQFGHIVWPH